MDDGEEGVAVVQAGDDCQSWHHHSGDGQVSKQGSFTPENTGLSCSWPLFTKKQKDF